MDGDRTYWLRHRNLALTRRRLLGASFTGAAGVAGLALAGCGGSSNSGKSGTPALAPSPSSSAAAAAPKRGGTWRTYMAGDPTNLDPYAGTALPKDQAVAYVYSRLFRFKSGPGIDPGAYSMDPDLAQSMEISPDGLKYVVKLRPNVKWQAPISRTFDADDVVYSWKRYIGQVSGTPAGVSASALNGYLDSVVAVDPLTVQFNMKTPRGQFMTSEDKFLIIMPRETGSAFNPSQRLVGTGPWIFDSYVAGSLLKYRRNPEWHLGPDRPYFDTVEVNIIPEYATRLNQFLAGRIDEVDVTGNDLKHASETLTGMQLFVGEAELPNSILAFSAGSNPWSDPRVRKAISMSLDRDAMLDAAYNLKEIEKLNLGTKRRWNNDVGSYDTSYWLDPQAKYQAKSSDPKITPDNQKSFAYSPTDAKSLLSAAGQASGFKTKLYTTSSRYGEAYNIQTQLIQQYAAAIGVQLDLTDVDYNSVFITQIVVQKKFDGILHIPRRTGVRGQFEGYYLPGQIANYDQLNDTTLNGMINDMLKEADTEAARLKVLNLQNYTNDKMYYVPTQLGAAGGYVGYAPGVQNVLTYRVKGNDQGNETIPYYWRA